MDDQHIILNIRSIRSAGATTIAASLAKTFDVPLLSAFDDGFARIMNDRILEAVEAAPSRVVEGGHLLVAIGDTLLDETINLLRRHDYKVLNIMVVRNDYESARRLANMGGWNEGIDGLKRIDGVIAVIDTRYRLTEKNLSIAAGIPASRIDWSEGVASIGETGIVTMWPGLTMAVREAADLL